MGQQGRQTKSVLTDEDNAETANQEWSATGVPLAHACDEQVPDRCGEVDRYSQELGVDVAVAHPADDCGPIASAICESKGQRAHISVMYSHKGRNAVKGKARGKLRDSRRVGLRISLSAQGAFSATNPILLTFQSRNPDRISRHENASLCWFSVARTVARTIAPCFSSALRNQASFKWLGTVNHTSGAAASEMTPSTTYKYCQPTMLPLSMRIRPVAIKPPTAPEIPEQR